MKGLFIEHRAANGLKKTWKIQPHEQVVTFGRSIQADLRSTLGALRGLQGFFEFRDDNWFYVNLDIVTTHNEINDGETELKIDRQYILKLPESELIIQLINSSSEHLFSDYAEFFQPQPGKTAYQLCMVYRHGHRLEVKIKNPNDLFTTIHDSTRTNIKMQPCYDWKIDKIDDIEIHQRTVYLNSENEIHHFSLDQIADSQGQKTMMATFILAMVFGLFWILSPRSQQLSPSITNALPPIEKQSEHIQEPRKQINKQTHKEIYREVHLAQKNAAAPKTNNASGGSAPTSVSNSIKNLASGKISQLIGKVAANVKSNRIVITQGTTASTQNNSGRALAAIGSVNQSGKDWSQEGKGSGVSLSNSGSKGNGNGLSIGNLKTGKTGSGGVGLLDDESEIVGGLDREVIAQYIRSQLGQILYCYERQLSANPNLYGKVAIQFTITGTGTIETQKINDSTLNNSMVEGCILQKVSHWKFPTPKGGTKVVVTYPFLFKSTN
jgi:hypothetical protein